MEAATYPDDIKYLHWNSFNNWHFNDFYWTKDGSDVNLPENPENVVWAIDECTSTLLNHQ